MVEAVDVDDDSHGDNCTARFKDDREEEWVWTGATIASKGERGGMIV